MNKNYLFKAAFALSVLFGTVSAFASGDGGGAGNVSQVFPNVQEPCTNPALVLNIAPYFNGQDFIETGVGVPPGKFGTENNSICVDVPVALNTIRVVFNLDIDTVDGSGNSVGLKHMYMLGSAIKDRMINDGVDPTKVQIVGVMHGSAAGWATKNAAYDQQHRWMDRIFALAHPTDGSPAVNMQLEICGVTMMGAGMTKASLYTYDGSGNATPVNGGRIMVNQGAIGRIIDLEQHGFVYIHEGYEDRD